MQKKQKRKKMQADYCFPFCFFAFLNVYDPKTHQIKAPNYLDWFFQTIYNDY